MSDTNRLTPELEGVEIHGVSRGDFILRGALAASAAFGTAAVSPFVSRALAQGGGDAEILNFALTLEYLEAAFYAEAQKKVKLSGKVSSLAKKIGENESEHVEALTQAIKGAGAKPVKAPKVAFPFSSEKAFLKLAQTLEDTGVYAYDGAAPMIKSQEVLASAGSIVQVEARHAAAIRLLNGQPPAPDAFDKTLSKQAVLKAVAPFVKS